MGKVLRETTASNVGTPSQHLRSITLYADVTTRMVGGGLIGGARLDQGIAGKRGWRGWPVVDQEIARLRRSRIGEAKKPHLRQALRTLLISHLRSGGSSPRKRRGIHYGPRLPWILLPPPCVSRVRTTVWILVNQSLTASSSVKTTAGPASPDSESGFTKKVFNGSADTASNQTTTFQPTMSTSTTAVSLPDLG